MKIIAIEKETEGKTANDFQPFLKAEARKVWDLYKEGIIREMYFNAKNKNAVLILECDTLEKAKEKLQTLPLVKEQLIDFEFIPLIPYPGFERLFEQN